MKDKSQEKIGSVDKGGRPLIVVDETHLSLPKDVADGVKKARRKVPPFRAGEE